MEPSRLGLPSHLNGFPSFSEEGGPPESVGHFPRPGWATSLESALTPESDCRRPHLIIPDGLRLGI